METKRSKYYVRWIKTLDPASRGRIDARVKRAARGHFGDHKPLGDGLFEMRFDFAHGYRVYYGFREDVLLLLALGGDKSGQRRDIDRARAILAQMKEALRREQENDRT